MSSTAIRFPEGTTFRAEFTLKDQKRQVISLIGAQLTFAAYETSAPTSGPASAWISKTVGDGVVLTDPGNGVMRVDFLPEETEDRAGTYDWELELVESNGDVWLAGRGKLVVTPSRRLDAS